MRRAALIPLAMGLLLGASSSVTAQGTPQRLRVIGQRSGEELFEVRGAAFLGPNLVALTAPGPAVHYFGQGRARSWGAEGSGPAELLNPRSIVATGDGILVRDGQLRKVAGYDLTGRLVFTRSLPAGMAYDLAVAGRDTILGLMDMRHHTVVRLQGARQDTILRYPITANSVRLSAPGAPSLTLTPPFEAVPAWTVLPDGRIAFWNGREEFLRILDRNGRTVGRIDLPKERYPVTAADRESWFQTSFPAVIRGRDVFGPLRAKARTELPFPKTFPAVMGLMADPQGGVWVLQTPSASGQRLAYLREGRSPVSMRLPAKRSLLAVGSAELAVHTRGADDEELIEIYRKPQRPPSGR